MSFVVGLTGGIGSGKSAASAWFESQNISVVDADVIAREVVQQGLPALVQIHQAFGDWVLLDNGELNRTALREYIFQFPEARKTLESITHPAIRHSIILQLEQTQSAYALLVSPLLFETNQHQLTQRTLLIDATEALQIERASPRDGQIKKIIQAQLPRAKKQQLADDIVLNDGHLDYLYQHLQQLHASYLILAKKNQSNED